MKKAILIFFFIFTLFTYGCGNTNLSSNGNTNLPSITFYSESIGEYYSVQTYGYEKIDLPENPERDGYVFVGWFFDNETYKIEFNETSLIDVPLTQNITIYAKWISERDYQIILYGIELNDLLKDYEDALRNYNNYSQLTSRAYDYYSAAKTYYNSIHVGTVRVYRAGRGFAYEQDSSALSKKNKAEKEMNNALELYNSYKSQKENYEQLVKLYEQKYSELAEKIEELKEQLFDWFYRYDNERIRL